MTTIRQEQIRTRLKRMSAIKRNCERSGRPFSGYLGVSYCVHRDMFRVQIGNKGTISGYFTSAKEAALFYDENIVKIHSDAITNRELGLIKEK